VVQAVRVRTARRPIEGALMLRVYPCGQGIVPVTVFVVPSAKAICVL
jgi:hypothetical protein